MFHDFVVPRGVCSTVPVITKQNLFMVYFLYLLECVIKVHPSSYLLKEVIVLMTPHTKYKLTRIGLRWKDKYLACVCNHKLCLILSELYTRKMEYRRC